MFSFLPSPIKGVLSALIFVINTVFWCLLLYPFSVLKLVPVASVRKACSAIMICFAENWISGNNFNLALFHAVDFQISGLESLDRQHSYLVFSNHQCWTDIVMLQRAFNRRIPFLRFFLKQELLYVPFLGLAWWALDFPFMKRYSAEYLSKHPEKRGQDLRATRIACERFRGTQISILNFLEGTRFTHAKHGTQNSPYKNLLKPKTGGVAFVLDAMGNQFDRLLDVTIYYPKGALSLWSLFCGRLPRVCLHVSQVDIPQALLGGNYQSDPIFRTEMQNWVHQIWTAKDHRIEKIKRDSV